VARPQQRHRQQHHRDIGDPIADGAFRRRLHQPAGGQHIGHGGGELCHHRADDKQERNAYRNRGRKGDDPRFADVTQAAEEDRSEPDEDNIDRG